MEKFVDGRGVALADYRLHLPRRVADWPVPERVRQWTFGFDCRWRWGNCFVCGESSRRASLEVHHLFAGRHGKSDELCAAVMLCGPHHREYGPQSDLNVGLLLWRHWMIDCETTDWVRCAVLRRRHLPDLVVDMDMHARWHSAVYGRPPLPV